MIDDKFFELKYLVTAVTNQKLHSRRKQGQTTVGECFLSFYLESFGSPVYCLKTWRFKYKRRT